ncbi:hypothetical protein JAAARDRAFT_29020 [Jaapia argillacea MUCL 33604]|uniref:Transcription initiation factor TFIID subunit 2 n=1 Tax=Jaapia argillacea MUCL 33604 TaxID=933084 RepID=A0A067Q7U7_9AGAM|nr:hypothetical protein JAAARDRAFT_29020 [Jaapia argillacea MUCL 33604]
MQRESVRRGFTISHQKVVLEIDFSGSIWGYTEITLTPVSKDLKTINLHSRQCSIQSITVASHPAEYSYYDPLSNLNIPNAQDCHHHPELKRKLYSALAEGDEGELSIAIPNHVSFKPSGHSSSGMIASEAATPEPQTPGPSYQQPAIPEYAPITVKIVYSLRNPVDGLQFLLPTDAYPYRVPHVYTTPSSPDAARCWVPCIDNLWEKCTWEFEFVVPKSLEEPHPVIDDEDPEGAQTDYPTVVICSGELMEQVAHPYNSSKTIFLFSQAVLTSVQHIAWAAGPFHVYPIPADQSASDEPTGASQPLMHAFCLPGHEAHLTTSVSFMRGAMNFYSTEFGSYPFGSHKLVFVDEMPTARFDSATLSLVTADMLHGEDSIDQVYETRHSLSHALACQWVGINIQQKAWSDTWLVNGLGLYITGLFLRKLFGNNEYRFRMKKDTERVLQCDNGNMPPICQPQNLDPPESSILSFINLKAPLVLHILDRRLCKSGTSLGLSRVLPKVFLSAISGEMPNNALSTHAFLRTCRKVSGMDPRTFAEQWIYGSGCPTFGFSATFNRKKMAVEITMRQEAPAYKAQEDNEVAKTLKKPVPFFEGQMTIRIHEADGTPYEHVLDIRAPFKRYEVPFNTKYKRVRRNTKRYLARQAAAQAAAEGDAEAVEAMGLVDMGFGLDIWEKEKERENWKVVDWTEEDEQVMSGATYEWIRIDADFEWIAAIAFEQPDFMWVSQLQRDRDVVAQLEALHALAKQPNAIVSSTLTRTVLVSNYFFRIRCEAAAALVTCAIRRLDFLGLFHLFKLFLRYCYEPDDQDQDLFTYTYVPRPNDFSDIAEYFVRKSILNAISRVRFENGKSPAVVRQFLIDQLRYNDNTANPYSDAFYICSIISASACATVSTLPPERGELLQTEAKMEYNEEDLRLVKHAVAEVDRYRSMDRLIPSPHNVVTIATIDFYVILGIANLIPYDPRVFFPLTREGHYTQVRMAAFDALLLTKWYTPKIMRYILAVMANDPSRAVRRHVARNACQSFALLVTMGDLKTSVKETESLLIEDDGTGSEKIKEAKKSEVELVIKALRKDREVGKNEVLREFLMPIALAADADHEVRWCVLKLADLLIRGAEEAPPKVLLHLPPTPVAEQPPPLLPLKMPLKAQRTLKAAEPAVKSPLPPFAVATKIRLPSTPTMPIAKPPAMLPPEPLKRGPSSVKPTPKAKKEAPKKEKNVPRAQSGGMSLNDLRASRNALKKLQTHKRAVLFLQPVDPVRDRAPNYFDVIKKPMDLSTINAKLEAGMYADRFAFEADFRLMINNAKTYNLTGTFAYNEAVALDGFFDKQWVRINKTLEAADKAHPPPPPPPLTIKPPVPKAPVPKAPPPRAPVPAREAPVVPVPVATPAARSEAPRPTIKLKVGGSQVKPADSDTPTKLPLVKPRGRKPKAVDMPPPADVDDDLLQEVIAIEREQGHHSVPEKKVPTEKVAVTGKRKKNQATGDPVEEDEILALATPAKKERPTPPEPSAAASTSDKAKSDSAPLKNKVKKAPPPPLPEAPVQNQPPPRVSSKGKEKEHLTVNATSSPSKSRNGHQSMAINDKKCRDILKLLLKMPEGLLFARPVDPVADGCPTYYDEIAHPMDFATMTEKLNKNEYPSMEDFAADMELVFSNCRKFNPALTPPIAYLEIVEKAFKKEWAKATEKKLGWGVKRSLQGVMTKLVSEDISWVFREPVDPVVLGIPTYFDIIPRKDARDLKTIRQKLDADKYDTIEAFEADLDLMIRNAIVFNGAESEVGKIAGVVKNRYRELLSSVKGPTKKRKDTDRATSTPQPALKKSRVG